MDAGIPSGYSKRLSSKAAASEGVRRTFRYVEPLSDVRTSLAAFFSILLSRFESSTESILTRDTGDHELGQVVFSAGFRADP
jgi:hypothetical protein